MSEELSVDGAVERLVRLAGASSRVIVGLVGEPGAGKSTVATALVAGLREAGISAALVPMDGFHLANAELARLGLSDRKGALETFDGEGYVALLHRLRIDRTATIYAPTYVRGLEESVAGAVAIGPDVRVVVTEGNYLLAEEGAWSAVRGLLDETWAVVADQVVRRQRLAVRHVQFGKSPEAATAWVDQVDEPNAVQIRASLSGADRTIRVD